MKYITKNIRRFLCLLGFPALLVFILVKLIWDLLDYISKLGFIDASDRYIFKAIVHNIITGEKY